MSQSESGTIQSEVKGVLNMSENTMPLLQQGQATSPQQCTTHKIDTHICTALCPACDMHHRSTSRQKVRFGRIFEDTSGYCYMAEKLVYPFRHNEKCAVDVTAPGVWKRLGEIQGDIHEMLCRLNDLKDAICEEQDRLSCEQGDASCL